MLIVHRCRLPIRHRRIALAAAWGAALVLAGCQRTPSPSVQATPEHAVATSLRVAVTGDFDDLMRNRLPASDYADWRADWAKAHAHPVPVSVAQQKQFAKIMQMLTRTDAEAKLMQRLKPELARLRAKGGQPAPVLAAILHAAGTHIIADAPQLGPAQRALAAQGLVALVERAKNMDFSDPVKAQRAIDLACATARRLHVATLKQWRALNYAETMRDYGIIWNGMESLLQIYGLNLGKSLLDAKITTVSNDGNRAMVRVNMTFAGKPLVGQWPMRKVHGHWYDAALLQAWRKAHSTAPATAGSAPQPAAPGTRASAPAGSAPRPAAQPPPPAQSGGSTSVPASGQPGIPRPRP
jgi:hypothetical protein